LPSIFPDPAQITGLSLRFRSATEWYGDFGPSSATLASLLTRASQVSLRTSKLTPGDS
jgi:hypothetical protein